MLHIDRVSKYKGAVLQIEFSNGNTEYMNSETAFLHNIRSDTDIEESDWEKAVYADNFRKAKERALYLLDYKDYSYSEIVKKLEKNYGEDIAFEVADKLAELKIIDDWRYAKGLARKYFEVKCYGVYRVKQELRSRGIPKAVIDEAVEPYLGGSAERICRIIDKKYSNLLDDPKSRQRAVNALARMGYSYDDIKSGIDEYKFSRSE